MGSTHYDGSDCGDKCMRDAWTGGTGCDNGNAQQCNVDCYWR